MRWDGMGRDGTLKKDFVGKKESSVKMKIGRYRSVGMFGAWIGWCDVVWIHGGLGVKFEFNFFGGVYERRIVFCRVCCQMHHLNTWERRGFVCLFFFWGKDEKGGGGMYVCFDVVWIGDVWWLGVGVDGGGARHISYGIVARAFCGISQIAELGLNLSGS